MADAEDEVTAVDIHSTPPEIEMHPHIPGVPLSMPSGMGRRQIQRKAEADQQPLVETAIDTLDQSIANSAYEFLMSTPKVAKELLTEGTAELEPHRAELTEGVPLKFHDDIMSSMTLTGAQAARKRIIEDQETSRRLAKQIGISSTAVQLATGLIDLDLVLIAATGGTVAAGKTAATAARVASTLGAGARTARVAGDLAVGLSGGGLAGALTGAAAATVRPDYDGSALFTMILAGAATGGILNPAIGRVLPDRGVWNDAAKAEYERVFTRMQKDLDRELADPNSAINRKDAPAGAPDSAGALSLGTAGQQISVDTLGLKAAGAPDSIVEDSVKYQNWRADYDYERLLAEDTSNPIVRMLTGGSDYIVKIPGTDREVNIGHIAGLVFTLGQRDFTQLLHSKSPAANFMAAEVLESASGVVRKGSSSGVLREMFHSSAMVHSAEKLVDARSAYFRERGLNPVSVESHRLFTRDVRLAMDEWYRTGKMPDDFADLIEGIDKTHKEILGHMQGLDEGLSVRGSREIEHRPGYFRYDWEPANFLRVRQQVGERALINAFREGYRKASNLDPDLAEKLARAVVRRFSDRGLGVNAADARLLDIDSRSGIEAVLEQSGLPAHEVESIMRRLDVNTQERATKGYLRRRTDVDLNTPIEGTEYRLVDLMTDDIERSLQQYTGDAAGAAALASKGIRDQADIERIKDTILFEQSAVGEVPMSREHLDAIFSQFTGGQHKGFLMGRQVSGVSPLVSMLTKATRASLLQRLGLTQLMDSANIFVANGLANSMEPVMAKLGWNKPGAMSAKQMKDLHGELQSIGAIVGQDHMLFRPHLSIDEAQLATNVYAQTAQTGLNTIERATNYASGQIHVTAAQQIVASAATATNVMRTLAGESTNLTDRMLRDMGLTEGTLAELHGLIKTGDITVNGGDIQLNTSRWSPEARQEFGAAMTRTTAQQVQRGLIGESSVWMNSDIGKLLSSLKTFALTAVQKQTARNLMIGGKQHFVRAAAWQLGFAYAVLTLSQTIQGSNMGAVDRARLAVAYTPSMGVVPMVTDPMTTMLGFDDMNFSPYGRYTSYLDTPVFEQVQKLAKAPGAISDMLTGDGDYQDMQNAKAMFFLNWYGMKQLWEAM